MTPWEAVESFKKQIERATALKVVMLPTPVPETVLAVKVAARKVLRVTETQGARAASGTYELRLAVSFEGKVESLTGMSTAVAGCASLASFLASVRNLEDTDGIAQAGMRITSRRNEDDGILEDPEGAKVAWVRDEHIVTIQIPA